jgi:hypothetical protein
MTVAIHLCRGNFRSTYFAEGGYEPIAKVLFEELDVDAYYLECAPRQPRLASNGAKDVRTGSMTRAPATLSRYASSPRARRSSSSASSRPRCACLAPAARALAQSCPRSSPSSKTRKRSPSVSRKPASMPRSSSSLCVRLWPAGNLPLPRRAGFGTVWLQLDQARQQPQCRGAVGQGVLSVRTTLSNADCARIGRPLCLDRQGRLGQGLMA